MISSSNFTCPSSGAGCLVTPSTPRRDAQVVDPTWAMVSNEAEPGGRRAMDSLAASAQLSGRLRAGSDGRRHLGKSRPGAAPTMRSPAGPSPVAKRACRSQSLSARCGRRVAERMCSSQPLPDLKRRHALHAPNHTDRRRGVLPSLATDSAITSSWRRQSSFQLGGPGADVVVGALTRASVGVRWVGARRRRVQAGRQGRGTVRLTRFALGRASA